MINDCFRVVSENAPNLGDGVGIGVVFPEMLTCPVITSGRQLEGVEGIIVSVNFQ